MVKVLVVGSCIRDLDNDSMSRMRDEFHDPRFAYFKPLLTDSVNPNSPLGPIAR